MVMVGEKSNMGDHALISSVPGLVVYKWPRSALPVVGKGLRTRTDLAFPPNYVAEVVSLG